MAKIQVLSVIDSKNLVLGVIGTPPSPPSYRAPSLDFLRILIHCNILCQAPVCRLEIPFPRVDASLGFYDVTTYITKIGHTDKGQAS